MLKYESVKKSGKTEGEKDEEYVYLNWLNHIPGIGRKRMSVILRSQKSVKWLLGAQQSEVREFFAVELGFGAGVSEKLVQYVLSAQKWNPEEMYRKMQKKGVRFLPHTDPDYPRRLRDIPDAPLALYSIGSSIWTETEDLPTVAIVGARQCSEYGRYIARQLGRMCAERRIRVVSGLAGGIDGIAQYAACEAGGMVAAVLGSGVDVCYPEGNRGVYRRLAESGMIYSEYVPGTEPRAQNFPVRNRIISGMSDAVIVVEAREKSGTLITVDMALEQGRDVYIIPGRLTDPLSTGCNRLISQGAAMVYDLEEMLDGLNTGMLHENKEGDKRTCQGEEIGVSKNPYPAEEVKHNIYNVLDIEPASVQDIYEKLNEVNNKEVDVISLQSYLLFMQMDGTVTEKDGWFGKKM